VSVPKLLINLATYESKDIEVYLDKGFNTISFSNTFRDKWVPDINLIEIIKNQYKGFICIIRVQHKMLDSNF